MRRTINDLWMERNTLDDEDNIEGVKEYAMLTGFKKYHFMIYDGVTCFFVSKGISSYLLKPCKEKMCIKLYKRDDFNSRKKDKFWGKMEFYGDDGYWDALRFLEGGKDI